MLLNHLHYGDCLHAMTSLPDRSVHLVLADLPDGRTKLRGKRLVWNKVVDLEQLQGKASSCLESMVRPQGTTLEFWNREKIQ